MTRKFLEDLGIEKETIDQILDEHSADIGKHKKDIEGLTEARDALEESIKERDKQLKELSKNANASKELKDELEALQEANQKAKDEYEAKIEGLKLDRAIETEILKSKGRNVKAIKALLDRDNLKLDGDNVIGLKDQLKALGENEDSSFLFGENSSNRFKGVKPGEKGDGAPENTTKNPWKKDTWNLTEQGRILREDPELAKQLKASI